MITATNIIIITITIIIITIIITIIIIILVEESLKKVIKTENLQTLQVCWSFSSFVHNINIDNNGHFVGL